VRQKRFVAEYLVDFNGTQAAIRAGYTKRNAKSLAHQLTHEYPKVIAAIEAGRKAIADRLVMSRVEVLRALSAIGRADIRRLYDAQGNLRPLHELDDETAASISAVEADELYAGKGDERKSIGVLRKLKQHDKIRALELLGKNHALWNDQPPPAPEGPGMTIVVQTGVKVDGQRVTTAARVTVNLPGPE
jgi:phage terminase small subunit